MIPTPESKSTLGEDFEDFLDLSLSKTIIEDKDFAKETSKNRIELLNLRSKPTLEIMLSVLKKKREQKKNPPKGLFDALDKEVRSDKEKSKKIMMSDQYGYFYESEWIDSWNIKIMDPTNIPKELHNTLKIRPPNSAHEAYLHEDGTSSSLYPKDILKPIATKKILPSLELWDKLRELINQIDSDDTENYGKLNIYPINEKLISPSKIIFDEKQRFIAEGPIGNWYILGPALAQRHKSILEKLGARNALTLTPSEILEILKSQKEMKTKLDLVTLSKILRLIKMLSVTSSGNFPNQQLWPAKCDGEFVWKKPEECYIKDTFSIPQEFEHKLNFIALEIEQKVDGELKSYAKRSGSQSFMESLKNKGDIDYTEDTEDEDSNGFYGTLSKALSQYSNLTKYAKNFIWLNDAKARISKMINVTYTIDDIQAKMNKAALVDFENSGWTIRIARDEPKAQVIKQLSEEIADTCIKQGYPESSEDLRNMLYKLLTNQINEWKYFIPDFETTYEDEKIVNPVLNPKKKGTIIYGIDGPTDIIKLEEVFQENIYGNVAGYIPTRNQLSNWYNYCQICGRQTPGDESGFMTYETLKRVFTRRGGRYQGDNQDFDVNNSLLLCPTHQVLWTRKLIRFPDLEKATPQLKEKILKMIEEEREDQDSISFKCEVFEGERNPGTGKVKPEWIRKEITFKLEHYRGFLKTLLDYLEKRETYRT